MVHVVHGVNAYQVSFPTHPVAHHLEVPRWGYCQNTEDCVEVKQPRGNPAGSQFEEALSYSPTYLFHFVFLPIQEGCSLYKYPLTP
jgi:hypothetical protein